jgi:hypothetical protein
MSTALVDNWPDDFKRLVTRMYEDVAGLDKHALLFEHVGRSTIAVEFQSTEDQQTVEELYSETIKLLDKLNVSYMVRPQGFKIFIPLDQFGEESEEVDDPLQEILLPALLRELHRRGTQGMGAGDVDDFISDNYPNTNADGKRRQEFYQLLSENAFQVGRSRWYYDRSVGFIGERDRATRRYLLTGRSG